MVEEVEGEEEQVAEGVGGGEAGQDGAQEAFSEQVEEAGLVHGGHVVA